MDLASYRSSEIAFYLTKKIRQIVASDIAAWLVLCAFFFVVSAAAHSGFIAKWSLHDASDTPEKMRYSFKAMVDGTAHKPFVYRQLVPALANAADTIFPAQFKNHVVTHFKISGIYSKVISADQASYAFRYRFIYASHFLSLFLSLFLLRSVILSAGGGQMEASFAPTAFILAYPYLQTVGGYFYDGVELAFFSAAVLAVLKRKYIIFVALSAVATYNKESFFFYVLTLYPLLRYSLNQSRTLAVFLAALLISGLVNVMLKIAFLNNDGGVVEFHFLENLVGYSLPWVYREMEVTYGMPGPRGTFFLTFIIGLLITVRAWPLIPPWFKMHAVLCSLINFPLFILFCATGELRNLSFLYVAFVLFLAFSIKLYSSDRKTSKSSNRVEKI